MKTTTHALDKNTKKQKQKRKNKQYTKGKTQNKTQKDNYYCIFLNLGNFDLS